MTMSSKKCKDEAEVTRKTELKIHDWRFEIAEGKDEVHFETPDGCEETCDMEDLLAVCQAFVETFG